MSAETCAYLNTDLTSFIDYLTIKYNLSAENLSNITAENEDYSPVYDEELPRVRNKFTGNLDYQLLSYTNSSIEELMRHTYHGFVSMPSLDDGRAMFVLESSLDGNEDIKGFKPVWGDVKGCLYVSLACYGSSCGVIKDLVNRFGGIIDEDDCDDQPYYYVRASESGNNA